MNMGHNSMVVQSMVAFLDSSDISLYGIELAGRAIAADARFNIWMLDVGKRKGGGDPFGLADLMIEFADPAEQIAALWKECAAGVLDTPSFERSLRPLVEEMESLLAEVSADGGAKFEPPGVDRVVGEE